MSVLLLIFAILANVAAFYIGWKLGDLVAELLENRK